MSHLVFVFFPGVMLGNYREHHPLSNNCMEMGAETWPKASGKAGSEPDREAFRTTRSDINHLATTCAALPA